MASYELVASRDLDIGDTPPAVGMTFPGARGTTWRVIRIDEATDVIHTGEPSDPHLRLICAIEGMHGDS